MELLHRNWKLEAQDGHGREKVVCCGVIQAHGDKFACHARVVGGSVFASLPVCVPQPRGHSECTSQLSQMTPRPTRKF